MTHITKENSVQNQLVYGTGKPEQALGTPEGQTPESTDQQVDPVPVQQDEVGKDMVKSEYSTSEDLESLSHGLSPRVMRNRIIVGKSILALWMSFCGWVGWRLGWYIMGVLESLDKLVTSMYN